MAITFYNREDSFEAAAKKIIPTSIIIDIGAGIMPQQYFVPNIHIIVEPYLPYINKLEKDSMGIPRKVYLNGTWDNILPLFPDKSINTIFALDVIEHFTKEEGKRFLAEAERVANSQIVVFTPLGLYPQYYDEAHTTDRWGMEGGQWQTHRSGWEPDDFGSDWDFIVCKDFHTIDQYDQHLDIPFGAFWAIRTFDTKTVPPENRLYVSELDDDSLAGYTRERVGEKLLFQFRGGLLMKHLYSRSRSRILGFFFRGKYHL